MKLTILGAAGVRTPLILQAIYAREERLGLSELALMDIDSPRLALIRALATHHSSTLQSGSDLKITFTTDARSALDGADYVITTFRVGGIESRVIDERVPLNHGILGQETTGPGGFAMGMRTIPVLLDYLHMMGQVCPSAWLINFANPSGMLSEAAVQVGGWKRTIGICDAPSTMLRIAAAILEAPPDAVRLDYFGLNHLGWVRSIIHNRQDHFPRLLALLQSSGGIPGLPFDPQLVVSLNLIPNEYLYYYYESHRAVRNILQAEECRGEQITRMNLALFHDLGELFHRHDYEGMWAAYQAYLNQRGETYMVNETGSHHQVSGFPQEILQAAMGEGYAGVALDLIEALSGNKPGVMILNIPNHGAIQGMAYDDVVEIPAYVGASRVDPLAVGQIPAHCLGLMLQVKEYEKLTIAAASQASYPKALLALTTHPLVADYSLAKILLDEYCSSHREHFPHLV